MFSRKLALFLICLGAAAWSPTNVGATTLELSADYFGYFCQALDGPGRAPQFVYETITVFSDPNGSSCTLIDDQEGPLNIYVVNKIPPGFGLVGSRFRVASSEGFNAEYVSEVIHLPAHLGDLRAGIWIAYGYCYTGTLLLATITYMGHGSSSPCAYLEVLPHSESFTGGIDVDDCYFQWWQASTPGKLLVNPSPDQCTPWCAVGVRSSTWGGVKALYR